jgi:hypothetical protein
MTTKSRESLYGASVRAATERATDARKKGDRLVCEGWKMRMLGVQGPAQPSPALGDAINAGFGYLEVKCLNASNGAARHRPPTEDDANPGAVHGALQGLLTASGATIQAQPRGELSLHRSDGGGKDVGICRLSLS